jgi:hypothetical protein
MTAAQQQWFDEMSTEPFAGSNDWRARGTAGYQPRVRKARKAPRSRIDPYLISDGHGGEMANPELGILKTLAEWDVKRNPNMTTVGGLQRWKQAHPNRLTAWRDVNNDDIPDALAGWDANADHELSNDEISHVNGYYLKKSDWPYRMRYNADKLATPEKFRNGRMPMSRYVRQMYKANVDPDTGEITYDPDPARDAWENRLREHKYSIKKPSKQLSPMNLWRMWCFKPVYDCFVYTGGTMTGALITVPARPHNIPLNQHPEFKSLFIGQKCYKYLFTEWLILKYLGAHKDLTAEQLKVITQQKDFKARIKAAVLARLNNLDNAWREVFQFLRASAHHILGLSPNTFSFNGQAIHDRYVQLKQEFSAREGAQGLRYIDPTIGNDEDQWVPPDYLKHWNEQHPKHPLWADHGDNYREILRESHHNPYGENPGELDAEGLERFLRQYKNKGSAPGSAAASAMNSPPPSGPF